MIVFKKIFIAGFSVVLMIQTFAQENKGIDNDLSQYSKWFTDGSNSFSLSGSGFLIGGSPVIGYSINKWAEVGLVLNYPHSSRKNYGINGDKLKLNTYGEAFLQDCILFSFFLRKYRPNIIG